LTKGATLVKGKVPTKTNYRKVPPEMTQPTFRTPEMQILGIFARFDPETAPKTIILPIFCEKARTETKTSRCTAGFRTCRNLASMQVGEGCQEMPVFCGQVGQEIQKSKILGCGMWDTTIRVKSRRYSCICAENFEKAFAN
jgi:hypothetical protein